VYARSMGGHIPHPDGIAKVKLMGDFVHGTATGRLRADRPNENARVTGYYDGAIIEAIEPRGVQWGPPRIAEIIADKKAQARLAQFGDLGGEVRGPRVDPVTGALTYDVRMPVAVGHVAMDLEIDPKVAALHPEAIYAEVVKGIDKITKEEARIMAKEMKTEDLAEAVANGGAVAAAPVVPTKVNVLPNLHQHLIKVDDGINIVLVGCGGTGGLIASQVLKIIGAVDPALQTRLRFVVVEGDTFEPKNLGRQLCIPPDMGKNKAKVIVSRYAGAYQVPDTCAKFVDKFIETENDLIALLMNSYTNVVIDAVDKNKPRNIMHDAMKKFVDDRIIAYLYCISCGNGEWSGQVGFGAALKHNRQMMTYTPGKTIVDAPYHFSIPMPYVVWPELLDLERDKQEEAMNCADRAVANAQTMVANSFAATLAVNYVNAIITQFAYQIKDKEDIPQTAGTVQFNAKTNGVTCINLTDEYLAKGVFRA
jgi:hypothetical protein